jgi:hypothetical protein
MIIDLWSLGVQLGPCETNHVGLIEPINNVVLWPSATVLQSRAATSVLCVLSGMITTQPSINARGSTKTQWQIRLPSGIVANLLTDHPLPAIQASLLCAATLMWTW